MKIIEKVEAIKNQDLTATENLEQMYSVIEEKMKRLMHLSN